MTKVFENIRKSTAHAMGGSFLLVSSRSPRLGFPCVVQRDHSRARPERDGAITQRPPQPHARPSIQQLRRSRLAFASNFGAPGQPSPATSALAVSLRQQLRRSRSTFASNTKAPANAGIDLTTMRVSKWYRKSTRKDDDSHSPSTTRVSDVVTGTSKSSYQAREPIENDEEGLAIEKDEYTSSTSTSSSVSTFSDCYDENEHNMWNPLLELFCHMKIGMHMETLVREVSTARVALSCHFALDSPCDRSESC